MSLLCAMFGHTPPQGYYDREGGGYFDVRLGATDGIHRIHADLYCECARCGERYQIGKIHVPQVVASDYGPPKRTRDVIDAYRVDLAKLRDELATKTAECNRLRDENANMNVELTEAKSDKCTLKCPILAIRPSARKYI